MIFNKAFLKVYLESFINHDEDLVEEIRNVSGAVIIKKDDKGITSLLLIKRAPDDHWPHVWEFPRGKCENKESIENCLKREVKEETGLDVKIIKFLDEYEYIADEGKRKSIQKNYLCVLKDQNQEVRLSFEHSEYKWVFTFAEVELMVPPEMKKTISNIFNVDSKIVDYDDADVQTIEE
jgi:8-oxo-dGTP diphosphatase